MILVQQELSTVPLCSGVEYSWQIILRNMQLRVCISLRNGHWFQGLCSLCSVPFQLEGPNTAGPTELSKWLLSGGRRMGGCSLVVALCPQRILSNFLLIFTIAVVLVTGK